MGREAASTEVHTCSSGLNSDRKREEPSPATQPSRACPVCESQKLYKDGLRYVENEKPFQRWLCRDCGYRFSEQKQSSNNRFAQSYVGKYASPARIAGMENLLQVMNLEAKGETKDGLEGATRQTSEVKGKILQFLWHLEKENRSKKTIISYDRYLRMLIKIGIDLNNPESVKDKVARQQKWGQNTKRMAMAVYKSFAGFNGISFTPPKYRITQNLPFIPLESEMDALIAASTKRLSAALQLLKEIPIRIGEALRLKWTEIDVQRQCIIINNTEKSGTHRAFKASEKLLCMLNALPKKNEKVFGLADYASMENQFVITRKRLANKLQNPRLMQIHFHTFRHWKATMEYHKTRDILHVMKLLGHKNLESTLVYTQLMNFESDEYHSAVAETVDEARKLLEEGFEYVCQRDDIMLFRKRK